MAVNAVLTVAVFVVLAVLAYAGWRALVRAADRQIRREQREAGGDRGR